MARGDDDAVGSAVTEAPGVLGEGAEVHAVSAAKAASPIPKARQGVEVTARPYDAGVAHTKVAPGPRAPEALWGGGRTVRGRAAANRGWLLTRSRPRRVPGRRWWGFRWERRLQRLGHRRLWRVAGRLLWLGRPNGLTHQWRGRLLMRVLRRLARRGLLAGEAGLPGIPLLTRDSLVSRFPW